MRNILLILLVFLSITGYNQVYNPSIHTPLNRAIGVAQAFNVDARSLYFDPTYQKYRAFVSTNEVLSYLPLAKNRFIGFDIIVNQGGSLSNGEITGGINYIYTFKNGTSNSDLVLKGNISTVNGQSGTVVVGNADSLKMKPVDISANRNNWLLTYDSANNKFILSAPPSGGNYTGSTTIDIEGGVISAKNTTSLWDANRLRGRNISGAAPLIGQVMAWDGIQYSPTTQTAYDNVIYSNDTLYFIKGVDTSKTYFQVNTPGDNWGFQTAAVQAPLGGDGRSDSPIYLDTTSSVGAATKTNIANLQNQINNITPGAGGKTVRLINPLLGDTLSAKLNDTTYRIKAIIAGANVSFTKNDSTITINSTPGLAEVNENAFTLTTTGSSTVSVESIVDYILVKPTSNLSAFKVGTLGDDDAFVAATPVLATGDFNFIIAPFYLSSSTDIYFSGITSSTDIKIIFKPLHQ